MVRECPPLSDFVIMAKSNPRQKDSSWNLNCLNCPTRRKAEWSVLSDAQMRLIDQCKITQMFQRGQNIYRQSQPCAGIHCIQQGTAAISKGEEQGGNIFVRLAYEGQTMGYRNLLAPNGCTTSAKALESSVICQIPAEAVNKLIADNPLLGDGFQTHIAEDLDEMEISMLQLASLPVRSRLARLLWTLSKRYATRGEGGETVMTPPITRRDMSELLCTRPETLTRTMQAMESEGLFTHRGQSILFPRMDALLEEINPH